MQEHVAERRVSGGVPLAALGMQPDHGIENDEASLTGYLHSDDTTVVVVDGELNVACSMSNAAGLLTAKGGLSIINGRMSHDDARVHQGLRLALANQRQEQSTVSRDYRRRHRHHECSLVSGDGRDGLAGGEFGLRGSGGDPGHVGGGGACHQ